VRWRARSAGGGVAVGGSGVGVGEGVFDEEGVAGAGLEGEGGGPAVDFGVAGCRVPHISPLRCGHSRHARNALSPPIFRLSPNPTGRLQSPP
jgi:hypothetical protein